MSIPLEEVKITGAGATRINTVAPDGGAEEITVSASRLPNWLVIAGGMVLAYIVARELRIIRH